MDSEDSKKLIFDSNRTEEQVNQVHWLEFINEAVKITWELWSEHSIFSFFFGLFLGNPHFISFLYAYIIKAMTWQV